MDDFQSALQNADHVVDAIFGRLEYMSWPLAAFPRMFTLELGFSFSGEIREPFPSVIEGLAKTSLGVTSVDAPSSWDIESGPPSTGPGKTFKPTTLVSLTAPKPLVAHFSGRHFIGGR